MHQDTLLNLQSEYKKTKAAIGLDILTGDPMLSTMDGIYDNYRVKRQLIQLSTVIASQVYDDGQKLIFQLLLVDEVMKAGKDMNRTAAAPTEGPED